MNSKNCFLLVAAFWLVLIPNKLLSQSANEKPSVPAGVTEWQRHMAVATKAFQGKDYKQAEAELQASLKEAEKLGPEDYHVATSLNNLAELYSAQEKYAEAEPLYKRSLAIVEKSLGPDHLNVARSLENYAALLRKTKRETEAAAMEDRAKTIRAKHPEPTPSKK